MAAVARSALLMFAICAGALAKLSDNKTNAFEGKSLLKYNTPSHAGASVLLADEMRQLLERYLFGVCAQGYKSQFANRGKPNETTSCEMDSQHDMAGRLASLSIRAQMAARGECSRALGSLASALADMARAAQQGAAAGASSESNKKRKLSKSQKAKLQAKQRTALAVKKKAAAAAAAAAAKMAS